MHKLYLKDSYMFYHEYPETIIDLLERELLVAGWTIDKKESESLYDTGAGQLYPMCTLTGVFGSPYTQDRSSWINSNNIYGYKGKGNLSTFGGDGVAYRYHSVVFGRIGKQIVGKNCKIACRAHIYPEYVTPAICSDDISNLQTLGFSFSTPAGPSVYLTSPLLTNFNSSQHKYLTNQKTISGYTYQAQMDYFLFILENENRINLGQKSTKLYAHTTTTQGETLYCSFYLNYASLRLECYINMGYNSELPVDRQPGNIVDSSGAVYEYFYLKIPEPWFPIEPVDICLIADTNHFYLGIYSAYLSNQSKWLQYIYVGQLDKFFNYNGGAVITGSNYNRYTVSTATTAAGNSNYYVLYEGTWYGKTIASSVSNKQGYIDLVTPSNYTAAGYNHYSGEIFVTQQVAGVNLGISDNFEYKPIGTLHNFYKHYGVTPTLPMSLTINGDEFWSFPLDTNNRIAFKAVDNV